MTKPGFRIQYIIQGPASDYATFANYEFLPDPANKVTQDPDKGNFKVTNLTPII